MDGRRSPGTSRPVGRSVSIIRRKSLWRMVKSMLIPDRVLAVISACGGSSARRRKMEKYRRGQTPRERPTRSPIPPPPSAPPPPLPQNSEVFVEVLMERLNLADINEDDGDSNSNNNVATLGLEEASTNVAEEENSPTTPSPSSLPQEEEIVVQLRPKKDSTSNTDLANEFHGWRKSSIDVTSEPPHTLKWIPSGLQIDDKVVWLKEEQPEQGIVRWIGKIRQEYYAGVEFEKNIGNSSGLMGYGSGLVVRLFQCDLGFGKFIPVSELVLYSDYHDKGVKAGFVCIICRDDFLEHPTTADDEGNNNMVATKCGHLYHGNCLANWFDAKQRATKQRDASAGYPCPHCQHPITLQDIIRLFPAQV